MTKVAQLPDMDCGGERQPAVKIGSGLGPFKGRAILAIAFCVAAGCGECADLGMGKEPGSRLLERCRAAERALATDVPAAGPTEQTALAQSCEAFLDGFIWGHAWASWREQRDMWFCLPAKFSGRQGVPAVVDYLEAHPERLDEDAHLLVFLALTAAYPCK